MSILGAIAGALSGVKITLTNQSLNGVSTSPTNAACSYKINTDGKVYRNVSPGLSDVELEVWRKPTASPASPWEARVTVTSGSLSSGTTGSWVALTSNRAWTLTEAVLGTVTCTFTVEIRHATTLVVRTTATIDLTAEKSL